MVKKLTKHGNSLALVIDRPILDLLKIDPETLLDVSTDGKQLIIAPSKPSATPEKVRRGPGVGAQAVRKGIPEAGRVSPRDGMHAARISVFG